MSLADKGLVSSFANEAEEEEYILKEDNNELVVESTGEEPDLKYEK